ncbi:hypothetical protein [Azonexus sp. R2A61]|uniref:hypothetical protein n=1 Tax=Azonexus sp. R2A61 TaxID=2744443 RepID=UPI001F3E0502|nr:hypothetical protein [Azonexus sp. R2A61]
MAEAKKEFPKRHQWAPPNGVVRWTHCLVCGVIQRRDGHQSACKGPVKVALRDGQ